MTKQSEDIISLLECEFNEKISDEMMKYYIEGIPNMEINGDSEAEIIASLLFGRDENRLISPYLADRHYDMKTAEDMLSASILSSQIMDAVDESSAGCSASSGCTVTGSDFCLYYDNRMKYLLLAADDTPVSYIVSLAVKRGGDYAEDMQNFITCKYLATDDQDEFDPVELVNNVERLTNIVSREEMGDSLISHFILFNSGDEGEILLVEVSPFGESIIDGVYSPIFITADGKIELDRDAAVYDPLMTLTTTNAIEIFSKLCELSPNFKIEISERMAKEDEEFNKFIKQYLAGRLKPSNHNEWTAKLLFSEKFSDVAVRTNDGVVFHAHKLILSNFSEYFNAMFFGQSAYRLERVVTFAGKGMQSGVFREILTYIYTGRVDFSSVGSVADLISAAEYLQVDGLVKFFKEELYTN